MTGWAPQPPKRTWRTAFYWLGLFTLVALVAWNSFHAGFRVGYQRGYDKASIAEAQAWSLVPRSGLVPQECPPTTPAVCPDPDIANTCERWWLEHSRKFSPDFRVDPRQAK